MNIGPIKALGLIGSAIMAASSLSHTTVASPEVAPIVLSTVNTPVLIDTTPPVCDCKTGTICICGSDCQCRQFQAKPTQVSKTHPPATPPAKAPVAPARPTYTYYYQQPQQSSCGPGGCGSGGRGLFGRRR